MPYRNRSVLFTKKSVEHSGFTLIEVIVVLTIFTLLAAISLGISFSQYEQWLAFTGRENILDTLIENRLPGQSTTTTTFTSSFGSFTEPITVYENGELRY